MPVINAASPFRWSLLGLLSFLAMAQASAPAVAGCQATVSLVDFGRLDLERGAEVAGELIVSCDEPGDFNVVLSKGIGDFNGRRMIGSDGNQLSYNLFVDAARQHVWGDGIAAGTQAIKGRSDGRRPSVIPIYGIVPARQSVLTGPYSDNLLVTVDTL